MNRRRLEWRNWASWKRSTVRGAAIHGPQLHAASAIVALNTVSCTRAAPMVPALHRNDRKRGERRREEDRKRGGERKTGREERREEEGRVEGGNLQISLHLRVQFPAARLKFT